MSKRAIRRHHAERMKAKMRRLWRLQGRHIYHPGPPDPEWVGKMAAVHGRPCSCFNCSNIDWTGSPTVHEIRARQSEREQRREAAMEEL